MKNQKLLSQKKEPEIEPVPIQPAVPEKKPEIKPIPEKQEEEIKPEIIPQKEPITEPGKIIEPNKTEKDKF